MHPTRAALGSILLVFSSRASVPARIVINDNRVSAGTLAAGVLTVHLEARDGEWHPDADSAPGAVVHAFAIDGEAARIPGPLLRVFQGTEVHAFVHNSLSERLIVHGLNTRGGPATDDTVSVGAGETREIRFTASRVGTFFYWAATNTALLPARKGIDTQLYGAIVVDPAGAPAPTDRIFMLSNWRPDDRPDTSVIDIGRIVINGRSWPNTERLSYTVGDTVRFRLINAGRLVHPMHLHGFYYNVDSRGSEQTDSVFDRSSSAHLVNTENLRVGRTYTLTWVPTRSGGWLFHCHDPIHLRLHIRLDGTYPPDEAMIHGDHAMERMMEGPVMAISVRDAPGARLAAKPAVGRRLRLVASVDSESTDAHPSFSYALRDVGMPPATAHLPGPVIVLQRGEPVSITVVNRLAEATSVHWHGIELDSYYDGVPELAGHEGHLAPQIAANDSFVARFTPPRSGTFMFHPHLGEYRQQQAGLDGVLLVVDDLKTFDAATNIVALLTTPVVLPSRSAPDYIYLNGTASPAERQLHAGTTYRVRLLNLHNFKAGLIAKVMADSTPLSWRAIAKDGMTLPPDQATVRPAVQQISNGETYDFEFTPTVPGRLRFDVTKGDGRILLVSMPLRVLPAK
jgi:FtsP/CotA-like multicopper oxidase with cupredoxin domain